MGFGTISLLEIKFAETGLIFCMKFCVNGFWRLLPYRAWQEMDLVFDFVALEHLYDVIVFVKYNSFDPGMGEYAFFPEVVKGAGADTEQVQDLLTPEPFSFCIS